MYKRQVYHLQPAAVLAATNAAGPAAAANPFFAAAPPPAAYLAWCALWVVAMLALAVASFRAREI